MKESDDLEAIKRASQELATASQKIGEILYKQQETPNQSAGTDTPGQAGEGSVKDAEFEEKQKEDEAK